MKRAFVILLLALGLLRAAPVTAAFPTESPFRLSWEEALIPLAAGDAFELSFTVRAPEGCFLYADETDLEFVSLEGVHIAEVIYPEPTLHEDPFTGRKVSVYAGDSEITIVGRVPPDLDDGEHDLVAELYLKGCSPTICYRPEVREIAFRLDISGGGGTPAEETTTAMPVRAAETGERPGIGALVRQGDFTAIMGQGVLVAFLVVFLAGILTSLTPCVWPVIPVVLLFVGVHPHRRWRENFLLALLLTAGLVLVYALLGVIAAAVGKNLGFLYQQRWFLALVVLFFVAMALSMFGLFDLRLPRRWQERFHRMGGEGYRGAFLAGLGLGLVASPCAGPVIAGVLGYVALQRGYLLGFALLIVYGLGMGLLFVVLGTAYGEFAGRLKGGVWMVWVRRALGVLLLFPAAFYMGSLFGWSPDGILSRTDSPRVEWLDSTRDAMRFARREGRPVMVEFTAHWCPPCRALDRIFFRRDDIVQLSYQLVPLRVDATIETEPVRRLIERYGVMGWPTVVFLSPEGKPYPDLRVSDSDPEAIERGMREAIERTRPATEE